MAVLQRESTEYIYIGVSGDEPSEGAELAFMPAAQRPESADWHEALTVDDQHSLWADAQSTGLAGDWFAAVLVGTFGDPGGLDLAPGDYQVWLRLTDTTERPVRIAPVALEIA